MVGNGTEVINFAPSLRISPSRPKASRLVLACSAILRGQE